MSVSLCVRAYVCLCASRVVRNAVNVDCDLIQFIVWSCFYWTEQRVLKKPFRF